MGMAASQARFLSLTARRTNVEFEGQQINQQRTTLSNESSNYYSQLCNMVVPTPPSSEDYSKTIYTFKDGSETNTINSLIAQRDGWYILNYTQSYETESVMSNGNVITTRQARKDENGNTVYDYYAGASQLRTIVDSETLDAWKTEVDENGKSKYDTYIESLQKNDPYLSTITEQSQLENVLMMENQYLEMLKEKYNEDDWFVRYQKNSSDGTYEPVFYSVNQVTGADYSDKTGASLSGVKSYVYGQTVETREIQNAPARVEQDTSGRYMSVIIYEKDSDGNVIPTSGVEFGLTATTQHDDRAYNDAMNQYNYAKGVYDKELQSINAKIEVIQGQDKDLELRLKQLDTEQNAISQEMEAVKKVITKNVETTFKTFNA